MTTEVCILLFFDSRSFTVRTSLHPPLPRHLLGLRGLCALCPVLLCQRYILHENDLLGTLVRALAAADTLGLVNMSDVVDDVYRVVLAGLLTHMTGDTASLADLADLWSLIL